MTEELLSFWEHVAKLRRVLLLSFCAFLITTICAFCFREFLFSWLLAPLHQEIGFVLLSPFEGFLATMKVSFIAGIALSSPLWATLLFGFVRPALKTTTRRFTLLLLALSYLLLALATLLCYRITLPMSVGFFLHFNQALASNLWSLSATLGFILGLYLAHMVAFELILLLFLLIHWRLIGPQILKKARPFVIISIFILSALLTPPDLFSQLALSVPLLLFYELGALYARFIR